MRERNGYLVWLILGLVLVWSELSVAAQKKPTTVAELALYTGADRQQILEEGAKKERKLTFYTSGILTQAVRPIVDAFQKKYPFIKVEIWRAEANAVVAKTIEEYKAGQYLSDVIEGAQVIQSVLQTAGVTQPYYSPNLAYIEEGALKRAPGQGVFAAAFRESGLGLGYNTNLITKSQLPKTYKDLLDPKWKGKVAIAGSATGEYWVGTLLVTYGEDFVRQIAEQAFDVQMVSAAALLDMITNGEYFFSPTIFDSHVLGSKQKGAPVDWVPLEPVHLNLGQIILPRNSPHPHAALLFIDFELSKESAEIHKKAGYGPTRKDAPDAATYKKFYGAKSMEEFDKWKDLFSKLFLKMR